MNSRIVACLTLAGLIAVGGIASLFAAQVNRNLTAGEMDATVGTCCDGIDWVPCNSTNSCYTCASRYLGGYPDCLRDPGAAGSEEKYWACYGDNPDKQCKKNEAAGSGDCGRKYHCVSTHSYNKACGGYTPPANPACNIIAAGSYCTKCVPGDPYPEDEHDLHPNKMCTTR
jgi:hypothetical protein